MKLGGFIGCLFFVMVFFAPRYICDFLMRGLSYLSFEDKFHWTRKATCLFVTALSLLLGVPSSLGFGLLAFISWMGLSILDIMDFISNSVLMPIVAIFTCIFVGFIIKPKTIADEVKITNGKFKGEKLFTVMIKWVAPIFLVLILASSVASAMGWFVI
ncbi:MAG: hypothetical protein ACLTST_12820 [Lachnospiraceae bacterium]